MKKPNNSKRSSFLSFLLILTFLAFNPHEGKSCIDPETTITVTTNYSSDYTQVAIVLGNLKLMTEQPNVFCSCALGNITDFFTNLDYVAFVEAGTTVPYPNMEPWENITAADQAWQNAQPNINNWSGFIAEVINNGLGPDDEVELIIRASTPQGYFVDVSEIDSTLSLSYLGTDAWDPIEEDLIADHQGVRNIGNDNSSKVYNQVADNYFTELDKAIISNTKEIKNSIPISVSPNPSSGLFELKYNLKKASPIRINVRDVTGRLVHSKSFNHQSAGDQSLTVDLPKGAINNGLYLVEILSNFENGYLKLLITE